MDGRIEDKIKTEQKILNKIKEYETYNLNGFYNYMSMKYEHKTKELYINYVINFLDYISKDVDQISPDDVNSFLCKLNYKEDQNGNIVETSGTYRATVHSALMLFFKYLTENDIIENNIMNKVPRPKNRKNNQIERIYLNPNEIQIMINNIKDEGGKWKNRNMLIMMTFLYTGMRCTALTEINIEDVDIKNKQISIIDKRNKKRIFKVDKEYIDLFLTVLKENREYGSTSNALFISNRLTRISQKTVSRMLEENSAILHKHITPHKMRRSYGRNLYNATGDIYAVMQALGHEDVKTTQLYVGRDETESAEKGMNAMKNLVNF